jgi:hypothetical protein
MSLLLQTASTVVGGLALAVTVTIILAIIVGHFARRERSKRITRLPSIKGIARSVRRTELAIRRRSRN